MESERIGENMPETHMPGHEVTIGRDNTQVTPLLLFTIMFCCDSFARFFLGNYPGGNEMIGIKGW